MRTLLSFLILAWLGIPPGQVLAQTRGAGLLQVLEEAFGRGDVEALIERAAPRVEIAFFEPSRPYSQGQARYVLKMFFRDYPPRRFRLRDSYRTHNGWLAEGDYWYGRQREPLRVYLRLQRRGARWELREILVEEGVK
ncbi:MAG: hypothetical protein KatS3mg044_0127 [Rhodothermaceae bacterium]|nr:MAG: DUF4783 domain-containing protein [Bacteroidota bacterium]GIV61261.1 MAG: hypothetical protein KatS3mg044_0127 [Rhodothermaceae bacterium]